MEFDGLLTPTALVSCVDLLSAGIKSGIAGIWQIYDTDNMEIRDRISYERE